MKKKVLNLIDLGINIFIFISVLISIISYFNPNGYENDGVICFRYFTILSNILVALTSALMAVFNYLVIIECEKDFKWFKYVRFASVVGVTLTMMTVVLYLGFVYGFKEMMHYSQLFLHLINPILAIVSFLFLENIDFSWKLSFTGIIPMFIYAIIYIAEVIILHNWPDFYAFSGNIVLSVILMFTGTGIIAYGLCFLRKLIIKKLNL